MAELETRVPLKWPKSLPMTTQRQRSNHSGFNHSMNLSEAFGYLNDEIKELAPARATLYSDIEQIGVERLRRRLGNGPAASLEIKIGHKSYFLACDRWQTIEHNLYALHLMLRNFRLMSRWGVGDIHQCMAGFAIDGHSAAHIIAKENLAEEWREMLGLGPTATLEDAQAVYRRRAKLVADDQDALMKLNMAIEEARKHLR